MKVVGVAETMAAWRFRNTRTKGDVGGQMGGGVRNIYSPVAGGAFGMWGSLLCVFTRA